MRLRRLSATLLPPLILLGGSLGAWTLARPRPLEPRDRPPPPPSVEVRELRAEEVRLTVASQGSVAPRTESTLVAEVGGRVISASPSLAAGGFFAAGDLLLEIDPRDYELAVGGAEAALLRLRSEARTASHDLERVAALAARGIASERALDGARGSEEVASAALREAELALARTQRDLERTRVRAPFTGRVREKYADVGSVVTAGTPLARVYAVDYAEVRLPVPDARLAFLDLPLDPTQEPDSGTGPRVRLRGSFGGSPHTWEGRIVRTEGEIDARSRMVHVIARVEDPYGRQRTAAGPPLAVGLFVDAEIEGRVLHDVFAVPRSALRGADRVLLVDADDRLRFRTIEVVREERNLVLARNLAEGERLCLTPLAVAVEGMRVEVLPEGSPPLADATP